MFHIEISHEENFGGGMLFEEGKNVSEVLLVHVCMGGVYVVRTLLLLGIGGEEPFDGWGNIEL